MNLRHRLRTLFRRRAIEAEMAEEMRFHLEPRAADLAGDGLTHEEAALAARRRFGNLGSLQEQAREAHGWGWLERLAKDVGFALRQLGRAPGFSLLAVVTLGLGLGANTAMFSMVNGISLKRLPYANLDRLDRVFRATPQNPDGNVSPADFLDLRANAANYGEVTAYRPGSVSLAEPGHPAELAYAAQGAANLFTVLGVQPALGRLFQPGDDTPGHDRVVVLSQRVWRNRFLASPAVVGHLIRVDGEPHEIIGVLPDSFNDWRHLGTIDFFRPLALSPSEAGDHQSTSLRVLGLHHDHLTFTEASGFFASVGARLAREFPAANATATWRSVELQSIAGGTGAPLILPLLLGLSGFVILIACSNLANFLLARTMARARELAVRAALGASRLQLLRPLIAEALVLSLAGGVLAAVFAAGFNHWASLRSTANNGEQLHFELNWLVLAWALGAAVLTALAFSLAPALFAVRLDINDTLKNGGRGVTGGQGAQRFRQVLIIGQFALAMVLLTGAALFIRGLRELHHRRSGWQSHALVTGTVVLPSAVYDTPEKITAFHRLAHERLTTLPGATSVSLSASPPFFSWSDVRKFQAEDGAPAEPGHEPAAMVNIVSPDYFSTYSTPIIVGRVFTSRDRAESTRVVILSQGTARLLFSNADPIGRRISIGSGKDAVSCEVIGVVGDVESVEPEPAAIPHRLYLPLEQEPVRPFTLAIRTAEGSPSNLVPEIRSAMAALDSDLPVSDLQPTDAFITRSLYQLSVLRDMLTAFGVLGLGLASMGIYGVITRTVAQRHGEFAIRLALGARAADINRLVLGTGVRQALVGATLGLLGAIGFSAAIASAFPGIHANSPTVVAATTLLLIGVALLACWLPARRAGRIDAISALRAD